MSPEEQSELLYRMDESMKYVKKELTEIKQYTRALAEKVDSLEGTIVEHKKFLSEHPVMCNDIAELKRSYSQEEFFKSKFWGIAATGGTIINAAMLLYISYIGAFK